MKVKDLIEQLSIFEDDVDVFIETTDYNRELDLPVARVFLGNAYIERKGGATQEESTYLRSIILSRKT